MAVDVLRRLSFVVGVVLCVAYAPVAQAQFVNDEIQLLLQQQTQETADLSVEQSLQVYQPVAPELATSAPSSRLESLYSLRAGRPLTQFGYDLVGVPRPVSAMQAGAVQDDYVLGVGDEIVVALRGQENNTYRMRVNRDGQILLPQLPPITAVGRTLGDVRHEIGIAVQQTFITTDAFVTVGQVRQASVLVGGEVRAPGTRVLSAMSSPLDAILLSGGVAKTGTLRAIRLVRNGQVRTIDLYSVLVGGQFPSLGTLQNGDRIIVPPLGPTVAVAGLVRRPGVYELSPGATEVNVDALIALAGGLEIPGNYAFAKQELQEDGDVVLVTAVGSEAVRDGEVLLVDPSRDARSGQVELAGAVGAKGPRPLSAAPTISRLIQGTENLTRDAYTVFALLVRRAPRSNALLFQPFSLEAVLSEAADVALNDDDLVYVLTIDQARVLAGEAERQLQRARVMALQGGQQSQQWGDETIANSQPGTQQFPAASQFEGIFAPSPLTLSNLQTQQLGTQTGTQTALANLSAEQTALANLSAGQQANVQNLAAQLQTQGLNADQALRTALANQQGLSTQQGPLTQQELRMLIEQTTVENLAAELDVLPNALQRLAQDYIVWVVGEVRSPGAYLGAQGSTLQSMIQTAGGVQRTADLSSVEVASTVVDRTSGVARTTRSSYQSQIDDFQRIAVRPLDVIRLRPMFSDNLNGTITLGGEVRYPGTFDVVRGERLSAIIQRAGGFTQEAYSYGAIYTRVGIALDEGAENERRAAALESQLARLSVTPDAAISPAAVSFLSALPDQVRDAPTTGRMTVTVDPVLLRANPELDILVEPGDRLFIPSRPQTVAVRGEVLTPGAFLYQPARGLSDYIELAGGSATSADERRIFVILPDGSAQPARVSWLLERDINLIPPGSTIIIPRDLEPFNLNVFLRDATQIMSQLAVSAASLAILGR